MFLNVRILLCNWEALNDLKLISNNDTNGGTVDKNKKKRN